MPNDSAKTAIEFMSVLKVERKHTICMDSGGPYVKCLTGVVFRVRGKGRGWCVRAGW